MKKLLFISFTLITFNILSQSSIWATSKNISEVQKSPEFISNSRNLKSDFLITQAFPSSRNPELLSVYEISCSDCNEVDLYSIMHKVPGLSGIEYAPKYETLELPNDYSITVNNNWALNLIGAENAWSYTQGDSSITLAISDQNYYQNHEDLIGKVKYYDATNTASRTHGTAVANIAGGNTNNLIGMSSIGYNSTLALYRMNYNEVLKASYAGARVINMSWSSGCSFNTYIQQAINEVYNNGTFLVAAAGNGSTCGGSSNLVYPAAYDNVFAVSSVGSNDSHISSNGNTHQHNSSVDLCAPGYNVPLTAAPGWYSTSSGTSFAAPFVTGTIGLMLSVNPDLTNSEIESILKSTSVDIYPINQQFIGQLGSGRLNAGEAVRVAYEMSIIVDDDNNNGHGNNEGGFDSSNPGNGQSNNGNQGGNGNHYGWNNSHNPLSENVTQSVDIYPNPSIGTFNLVGLNTNSNIYDSFGKIVMELKATDFQQIEIKIPGVYYLDLDYEIKKIIIQ